MLSGSIIQGFISSPSKSYDKFDTGVTGILNVLDESFVRSVIDIDSIGLLSTGGSGNELSFELLFLLITSVSHDVIRKRRHVPSSVECMTGNVLFICINLNCPTT